MKTYKEIKKYLEGIGVEVDSNTKKEIAARMILGSIKITPLIRLTVNGVVNGEVHEYSQFVSVRDNSINQIVGIFTQAENVMSEKYRGVCELMLDDFINGLEDMELGGDLGIEEWLREHIGKGLEDAEPEKRPSRPAKKTAAKKAAPKKDAPKKSAKKAAGGKEGK